MDPNAIQAAAQTCANMTSRRVTSLILDVPAVLILALMFYQRQDQDTTLESNLRGISQPVSELEIPCAQVLEASPRCCLPSANPMLAIMVRSSSSRASAGHGGRRWSLL
jgi:hypothetical protein